MKKIIFSLLLCFGAVVSSFGQIQYELPAKQLSRPVLWSPGFLPYNSPYGISPLFFMVTNATNNPLLAPDRFCTSTNFGFCFPTGVKLITGDITASTLGLTGALTTPLSIGPACILAGGILSSNGSCPATTSIDGQFAAFTFTGPGVSHTGTTYTFSGSAGSGVSSISGGVAATGAILFNGPGVSQSGNTFTFTTGGGSVTSASASNPAQLFTVLVNTPTTTPAFVFSLNSAGAHTFFGNNTGSTAAPQYYQPNFTDLAGTASAAQLPLATTSAFGAVKPDGTTVTITGGVISATGGGTGCSTGTFLNLAAGNGSGGCADSGILGTNVATLSGTQTFAGTKTFASTTFTSNINLQGAIGLVRNTGASLVFGTNATNFGIRAAMGSSFAPTSGGNSIFEIGAGANSFTPTSGTATFAGALVNPTINGTGTGTAYGAVFAPITNVLTGGTVKLVGFGTSTGAAMAGYSELAYIGIDGSIHSTALAGSGTRCLQVDATGAVGANASACGAGGGISGLTTGYVPQATSSTAIGNSFIDYGVTNAGAYSSTKDIYAPALHTTDTSGAGFGWSGTEGTAPSGVSGVDGLWADSTAHRWSMNNNNTGAVKVVGAGTAGTSGHIPVFSSNGIDIQDSGAAGFTGSFTTTTGTCTVASGIITGCS